MSGFRRQGVEPTQLPTRAALNPRPLPVFTVDEMPVTGTPQTLPELDRRLVRALRNAQLPGMILAVSQGGQTVAGGRRCD